MSFATTQPEFERESTAASQVQTKMAFDSLATGVIFALLLTVFQRVVGFGRGLIFCRLMSDQELGQWSLVWSFLLLLAPLAMLGIPGCFGKYVEHFRQRGQLVGFVKRSAAISLALAATVSATMVVLPGWFATLIFNDPSQRFLIRSLAVTLMAIAISNFAISLMEALRQVRAVTWMRFITGTGFAFLGTAFLLTWENASAAVTLAYGLCCLMGLGPAIFVGLRLRKHSLESESALHSGWWKTIAPFAMWLWVSNLMHNLFEVTDRYMLVHLSDVSSDLAQAMVGQYHSGRVIPLLLVSVAAMLAGLLLPYMSAAWESDQRNQAIELWRRSVKLLGIAFTVGGLLVLAVSPILFDRILQGRYDDGLAVLPLTMVYCAWFGMYSVAQNYLWICNRGKLVTIAVTAGIATNVLLNLWLIPWIGLWGAVTATSLSNALVIASILWLCHHTGAEVDTGLIIISLSPLLLLLPIGWGLLGLAILAMLMTGSEVVFERGEKTELTALLRQGLVRMGLGRGNSR